MVSGCIFWLLHVRPHLWGSSGLAQCGNISSPPVGAACFTWCTSIVMQAWGKSLHFDCFCSSSFGIIFKLVLIEHPRASALLHVAALEIFTMVLGWFFHGANQSVIGIQCYDFRGVNVTAGCSSCFPLALIFVLILTDFYHLSLAVRLIQELPIWHNVVQQKSIAPLRMGVLCSFPFGFADGLVHGFGDAFVPTPKEYSSEVLGQIICMVPKLSSGR